MISLVKKNIISFGDNETTGIRIEGGVHSVILNSFESNSIGVAIIGDLCKDEMDIQISENNFLNNTLPGFFAVFPKHISNIKWSKNYWQRPRLAPKIIIGMMLLETLPFLIFLPWINFDMRPALKPYDIRE